MQARLATTLQAAAWMYRMCDTPSPATRSRFIEWCASDVRHCAELLALLAVDARLDQLRGMKIDPRLMHQSHPRSATSARNHEGQSRIRC